MSATAVADVIVGAAVLAMAGAAARRNWRVGALLAGTAVTWFAGSANAVAVFWHRGPLVHLLFAYPSGQLRGWPARLTVALAYLDAVVVPVGHDDRVTLALAAAVIGVALGTHRGPNLQARCARAAAVAVMGVLGVGAMLRMTMSTVDHPVLWAYDAALVGAAVAMYAGLYPSRIQETAVTGLVVDLGDADVAGSVRDKLARVLGDPSVVVGYHLAHSGEYIDERGRPIALPEAGSGRAVTPLDDEEGPVGMLVHDGEVLRDPPLVEAVASVVRIALSNARLQADIRARIGQIAASRARIVAAEDAQRSRLSSELRDGPERRLDRVAALLTDGRDELAQQLDAARAGLRELARGVHPRILAESGLAAALDDLAHGLPIPVRLDATERRFPPTVELTAYFLCAEGLTNIAKYAGATCATVRIADSSGRLVIEVVDDGRGGADPDRGSGLRGLADRVEALGGWLRLDSPKGAGTRLTAEIPLP